MNIREFDKDDFPKLLEILELNIPKYFAKEEIDDFRLYIQNELEKYFVAEVDGEIVGSGGVNLESENKIAKIAWDFINPQFQKQGVGKELLQFRLNYIKTNFPNYTTIVRTSQVAYKFYEKNGFKLSEIRKNYWAEGFDLYKMTYE